MDPPPKKKKTQKAAENLGPQLGAKCRTWGQKLVQEDIGEGSGAWGVKNH